MYHILYTINFVLHTGPTLECLDPSQIRLRDCAEDGASLGRGEESGADVHLDGQQVYQGAWAPSDKLLGLHRNRCSLE